MKNWKEYFDNTNKNVNEEHHKFTREERIDWICQTLEKLSDDQIEKVYDWLEDMLDVE